MAAHSHVLAVELSLYAHRIHERLEPYVVTHFGDDGS